MNIQEFKQAKETMKREIIEAIGKFETLTGYCPSSVDVDICQRTEVIGGINKHVVRDVLFDIDL